MKTRHTFRLFLCGFFLFCTQAVPHGAAQGTEKIISANLKYLSLGRDLKGVDIYLSPEKRIPVQAAASYISQSRAYNGPQRITFVKAKKSAADSNLPATPPSKATEPEILAAIELDPAGGDYLLLFSGSADTRLDVMAVPFSSSDVPYGSCLVWNITRRPLGVVFGGDQGMLVPKQRQIFRPAKMTKDYFDFRIFDEYQGAPRALAGGPHFLKENSRQLIFLTDRSPNSAAVQVRVIEEMPEQVTPVAPVIASARR